VAPTFQSRSGFSPCFDFIRPITRGFGGGCFNPGLGFLPASTSAPGGRERHPRPCFNPGLGFLPASTAEIEASKRPQPVSIPVWVFSLLRQERDDPVSDAALRFNPGLGFLPASTVTKRLDKLRAADVSIPVWVFSLLRPVLVAVEADRVVRFNPGLGFLPASTNPCGAIPDPATLFQSRSGFSPCFDRRGPDGRGAPGAVSIPVWVFSLLRPASATTVGRSRWCFNPGLGFLPASTQRHPSYQNHRPSFNPGLGFLPASTAAGGRGVEVAERFNPGLGFLPASTFNSETPPLLRRTVSIPVWVFSLLRRSQPENPTAGAPSFNPGLGFLPASTRLTGHGPADAVEFQSRSGFSPCFDRG